MLITLIKVLFFKVSHQTQRLIYFIVNSDRNIAECKESIFKLREVLLLVSVITIKHFKKV